MKRQITFLCLIGVVVAGILVVFRSPPPAPPATVIAMPQPYRIQPQRASFFNSCVPRTRSWAWLWRLRELVMGKPKTIDLTATYLDLTRSGGSFLTNRVLAVPQFTNANGLKLWLLSDAELNALRQDWKRTSSAELLGSPRIVTADGMAARLMSGESIPIGGLPTIVGQSVDLLAYARRASTDLAVIVNLTEAITNQVATSVGSPAASTISLQTNLSVGFRIQIPKATGVFLVDTGPKPANQKRIGVILTIAQAPAKN